MGGGSQTPTDSPVKDGGQSFETRKSPSTTSTSSSAQSSTGSESTPGQQSRSEQEVVNEIIEEEGFSVTEAAVNVDFGRNPELASEIRATDTSELEQRLTDAKQSVGDGQPLGSEERFIGGVLAARSDSDVTVSDVLTVESTATDFTVHSGLELTEQEVIDGVVSDVNETFEIMDEYVAGKTLSNISSITVKNCGSNASGRKLLGQYNRALNRLTVDPYTQDPETEVVQTTISHEIGHAAESAFNTKSTIGINKIDEEYSPEDLEFRYTQRNNRYMSRDPESKFFGDPEMASVLENNGENISGVDGIGVEVESRTGEAFRNGVEYLGSQLKQSELGNSSDLMREKIREYQLLNASELFAVGYGNYCNDFVTVSNKQPGMVDHIDEFVSDSSWTETSLDTIETSGVGMDNPMKNDRHIPNGMSAEDVGQVVKVNFADGHGIPHVDADSWTGFATKADSGEIQLVSDSDRYRFIDPEIESVEVRDW